MKCRRFTIQLSATDHRAFASAVRLLRTQMRAEAPDIVTLLEHNLSGREAAGLADDYLAFHRWPVTPTRYLATRRVLGRLLPKPPPDPRRN